MEFFAFGLIGWGAPNIVRPDSPTQFLDGVALIAAGITILSLIGKF